MAYSDLDFGRLEIEDIFHTCLIDDQSKIDIDNVYIKNIFRHGKLFGYHIYELVEEHNRIIGYGIQLNDFLAVFNKYFNKYSVRKNLLYYTYDDVDYEFIRIDANLLELIKSTEDKQYGSLPIAKMIIFDNETEYIKSHVKRAEIYMISKIAIELADFCKIELQSNVLDYRIDALFTITSLKCDNIDKIALEIDEDDHKTYDPEYDKLRSEVIKICKNKIVKIPVRRKASCSEMDEIIKSKVEEIKLLINDLIAQYSIDSISHDEFVKLLQKEMTIDMDFAKLFAKQNHPILDNYKYLHSEIAKFLGYVCDHNGNYRKFSELIKKNLKQDLNYITVIEDDKKLYGTVQLFNDDTKVGRGQKIKYYLNRLGFYLICMSANTMKAKECKLQFGKVYEIALNYTNSLKHKIIESHTTSEVMKNILTQRINDKVEDKMSIKRESKIEVLYNKQISDINELKQIIKSKNEENNKLNDMIDNLQKIIKSKDELLSKRKAYQRKIDKYLIVDYASIKYILKLDTIISYKLKKFYGKYCQLGQ
jgi:hypothetical protein